MRLKSFVLLAGFLCISQLFYAQSSFPYDSAWKKIDLLLNKKGLPQSALAEVNKVYAAAKRDKREDQWIKAAIYRIQLTENGADQTGFNLKSWDSAMAGAPARVRAILLSAEAEALRQYQPGRYYRNGGQTTVTGDSSSDISTWAQEKISRLVTQLFLQSLSEPALLKQMPLKGYDAVLIKGNMRKLRPTLFDLLVVRAIDFFSAPDAESSGLNPITATPQLLASAQDFCHARFPAGDSSERTIIALKLYQDILLFHTPDADASAFVNVDIDRLSFAYGISTTASKDSLYLAALARIGQQFSRLPVAAQAGYLRASWYSERAGKYDPLKDNTNRFDLVTALSIAGQVASLPDSSEGRSNSRELMNSIRRQTLQVQSEKVNLPGVPFRILATYKNVKKIYGRIIRIARPTGDTPGADGDSQNPDWNMLRRLPAVQQFGFVLPETNDYQQHRTELPMQALPVGQYAILTSSDSLFSAEAALSLNYFFQSSIAYVRRGADFFVVDRMTGMPLNQVEINSYHRKYDYKTSRNLSEHDGRFVTDASGHFHAVFTGGDDYSPRTFSFSYGKDFLISGEEYNYSYSNRSNDPALFTRLGYEKYWLRSSLFIDRGIYRPGQTVFVKSILMTRDFDSQRWRVAAGVSSKLYLLDVNGQVADSVSYTSGEYGSFASSFKIPKTGLTGSFEVRDSVTMRAVSFSVEEYKRPKFFVKLDTIKGIIRLNDSVHFTGAAVAFAGNAIGNAKVAYRIYREARYPYPWYFRAMPSNSEAEIVHGIVSADEQGRFRIPFFASPDPTTDPASKPVFSFRISVTVTDANGETREGSSSTAVSAQSFQFFQLCHRNRRLSVTASFAFPLPPMTRTVSSSPGQSQYHFTLF